MLPFAALSWAQVVPGDYGDTAVAFDPASGSLTGYHESFRIGNGSASSPQFGCSFFFVGEKTRRGGAPRFRIEAAADPDALSRGESEASGVLEFPGERVRPRFARDELPGCRSVQDTSDLSAELKQRQEWLRIGILSEGAPFRRAPALAAAAMDLQAPDGQLVYVRERRNCWLYADHRGPRNPVPSSSRLGDDPVTRGWVHASSLHPATGAENSCGPATTGPDRRAPHVLSVGAMRVRKHRRDSNSDPDPFVRVRRHVPEIQGALDWLGGRVAELAEEHAAIVAEVEVLEAKDAASKVAVGDALSDTQLARLRQLETEVSHSCVIYTETACAACSPFDERDPCPRCAKCRELEYLTERKTESEVVPGEPLTESESVRLAALTAKRGALQKERADAQKEQARLDALLSGRTRKVETSSPVVNFGDREILTVYEGDELDVEVWDEDFMYNDLYGRTTVILDRRTLEKGVLRTRMTNVEYVELKFRPGALR